MSTRKAPGNRARSTAPIALSDAEKNLSLSDSTFAPYAIDRTKDPVRLSRQKVYNWLGTEQGLRED